MKVYTYTIKNILLNEVIYVGKSKNPKQRWASHKSSVKSIGKTNEKFVVKPLHYHMNEYDIKNFLFEVVADYNCEGELQEKLKPLCNVKYENYEKEDSSYINNFDESSYKDYRTQSVNNNYSNENQNHSVSLFKDLSLLFNVLNDKIKEGYDISSLLHSIIENIENCSSL